ncbi:hypothetical protein KA996_13210 [bacterium]|nr:hypothetical protein [bacterium]
MDNEVMKNEIEISLRDIVKIFKRNLKIFFITAGSFFVLSVTVYLFFITPLYEVNATAEIRTNESAPMMSDPMAFLLSTAKSVDSSIDIDLLKSRKVLNKVIESLNLQMKVTRDSNNMFMYFLRKLSGTPDCNAHVFFKQFPDSLKNGEGNITASESGYEIFYEGNSVKCYWGKECVLNSGTVVLEKTGLIPETVEYSFFYEDIYANRMALMDSTVVFPSETSSILNLSFVHTSPEMGANILNKLIESYVEVKKEWMKEDENVKQEYINSVLDQLEKDLEDKGRRMILFQKEKETIIPEIQVEELLKKQEILKAQIDEIDLKISLIDETSKSLKDNPESPLTVPVMYEDLSFQESLKTHNKLIFMKNELLMNMTPEHPSILASKRAIVESAGSIESMLNESIKSLKKSRDVMSKLVNLISQNTKEFPENLLVFAELKRDIELAEKVFVTLSAQLYQSSIDPNTGILPVRIIDTPDPIVPKSSPKTSIFGLLLIFFSIFIGTISVFIKDFFFVAEEGKNEKN